GLLQRANAPMNRAQTEPEYYNIPPRLEGGQEGQDEIDAAYAARIQRRVSPLGGLVERGVAGSFQTQARAVPDDAEGRFSRALEGFDFWRASQLQDEYVLATQRYQGVLIAVAVGGTMAALLVFSTYLFLRRRVLQPLQEAGRHFDRMAAGDLTAR